MIRNLSYNFWIITEIVQIFTVPIWGSGRGKFKEPPETLYDQKQICVTGVIKEYKGKPEIIVNNPEQIQIK